LTATVTPLIGSGCAAELLRSPPIMDTVKMELIVLSICVALLVLILVGYASAPILSSPNSERMFADADLVCKGAVIRVWSNAADHKMYGEIQVDQVFKGDVSINHTVIALEFADGWSSPEGSYRLLFLIRSPDGLYWVIDPIWGNLPASARLLDTPKGATEPIEILKFELVSALQESDSKIVIAALLILGHFRTLEYADSIKRLIPNRDKEIEGNALSILMLRKEFSVLNEAVVYAQLPFKDGALKKLQSDIGLSIMDVRDVQKLPLLHDLTASRNTSLRYGAIQAIRQIASPSSIPYLIERLDDDQQFIRFSAVMALAQIVGRQEELDYQEYGPGFELYKTDESRFINNWKNWWQAKRRSDFQGMLPQMEANKSLQPTHPAPRHVMPVAIC